MPAGRPPLFTLAEDLQKLIDGYFEYIKGESKEEDIEVEKKSLTGQLPPIKVKEKIQVLVRRPEPPTITGLALYCNFESRQSFYDYEKNGEFSYTIKRARLRIEMEYEKALHGTSPTGAIFALKNFGWKDKQEVEQTGGLTIKFEDPGSYIYPTQDQGDSGIPESL